MRYLTLDKNFGRVDSPLLLCLRCADRGLLLPLWSEYTWPVEVRALLYLMGLLYCFLGVAIIADIFMGSIEKITSKTRKVRKGGTDFGGMTKGVNLKEKE